MSASTRLLLVLGGCLLLLVFAAFVAYPLLIKPSTPATPQTTSAATPADPSQLEPLPVDSSSSVPNQAVSVTSTQTTKPDNTPSVQQAAVLRLARLFAERFGSYSNDANFANITSLSDEMTDSMATYSQGLMKQERAQPASGYYGVTTNLMTIDLSSFTVSASAEVALTVRQTVQDGLNGKPQVSYKDGTMDLVYKNGTWLVNSLYYK